MIAGDEELVHASCVEIGGRGVLIAGPSGSGKSDLAYRLIDRGAVLVSDDYSIVAVRETKLIARAPDRIAGKIELRGVGLVDLPFTGEAPLSLLVDLAAAPERLPEVASRDILGSTLPVIALSALEPSAPIKVEAALKLYGLNFPCRA